MGQIRNTANQNNVYRAVRHGLENLASKLVFLGDDRFESSVILGRSGSAGKASQATNRMPLNAPAQLADQRRVNQMRIAVINETSAANRNADILAALQGRGHEIINAGMTTNGAKPELSYIHTGLMTAILLHLNRVDFVVGGCGTGQGYLNSVMQYPGVFCGHILNDLDAWLFMQINGGNCISLALNQGYGWAGDVNLRFIFDRLFSVERGGGYPPHRALPQKEYRDKLARVSDITHRPFAEIISSLPDDAILPALDYPGMKELVDVDSVTDPGLKEAFRRRMKAGPLVFA